MAAKTLPPLAGFFFAAGFPHAPEPVFFWAPGTTHLLAEVALYPVPVDVDFFPDFCFAFAAAAARLAVTRASKASSSSNQPLLEFYAVKSGNVSRMALSHEERNKSQIYLPPVPRFLPKFHLFAPEFAFP